MRPCPADVDAPAGRGAGTLGLAHAAVAIGAWLLLIGAARQVVPATVDADLRMLLVLGGAATLAAALVLVLAWRVGALDALGLWRRPGVGGLCVVAALVVASAAASWGYEAALSAFGAHRDQAVLHRLLGMDRLEWALAVLCIGILVPIGEELLFRGCLYAALRRRLGVAAAAVASAAAFAVVHEPLYSPPIFALGLVLALLNERSGGVHLPILLHAGNNLLALAVVAWR